MTDTPHAYRAVRFGGTCPPAPVPCVVDHVVTSEELARANSVLAAGSPRCWHVDTLQDDLAEYAGESLAIAREMSGADEIERLTIERDEAIRSKRQAEDEGFHRGCSVIGDKATELLRERDEWKAAWRDERKTRQQRAELDSARLDTLQARLDAWERRVNLVASSLDVGDDSDAWTLREVRRVFNALRLEAAFPAPESEGT